MHFLEFSIGLLGVASQVGGSPTHKRQTSHNQAPSYSPNPQKAAAVKDAFQRAWDGYYEVAFPHDSLKPISKSYSDDRNGWGASAVDALSTALVMRDTKVIEQILEYIPDIDFSDTDSDISLFETTIRYLGGLLSAYDLLTGPLKDEASKSSADAVLKQARRLADNLKVGFDTPSGVPDNTLRFNPPRRTNSTHNGLATTGTLVMEWTRLSDLTGDDEYGRLAQKAESYLLSPEPAEYEPWPGLVGTNIDIETGEFLDGNGGWTGGTDSFYEYLIKMYLYDPERFEHYKDRWVLAADSSIEHLASHPSSRPDLTFLAYYQDTTPIFMSQHLACFDGGNFILGGLTLNRQDYIDFGIELTASCHATYAQTATRLGPESFRWQDGSLPASASNNGGPPSDQADFYEDAGFWIDSAAYILRPEVIESYYYAYRATGDVRYQEWAWDAFVHINASCTAGVGFSGINNVNAKNGGGFTDFQESFLFAEVLKYAYLIHAEEDDWQVKADQTNRFVYNTEAHPIRVYGREG